MELGLAISLTMLATDSDAEIARRLILTASSAPANTGGYLNFSVFPRSCGIVGPNPPLTTMVVEGELVFGAAILDPGSRNLMDLRRLSLVAGRGHGVASAVNSLMVMGSRLSSVGESMTCVAENTTSTSSDCYISWNMGT